MQDRPTAVELLQAVREYLLEEVVPGSGDHRSKFRALVAANVVQVLERELIHDRPAVPEMLGRLNRLRPPGMPSLPVDRDLQSARSALEALCQDIRSGVYASRQQQQDILDFAEWHVTQKLQVSNPNYLERLDREQQTVEVE